MASRQRDGMGHRPGCALAGSNAQTPCDSHLGWKPADRVCAAAAAGVCQQDALPLFHIDAVHTLCLVRAVDPHLPVYCRGSGLLDTHARECCMAEFAQHTQGRYAVKE